MKHFILFLFAAAVLTGCTKQSNPVTNFIYTHSDSALVGTMTGFFSLYGSQGIYSGLPALGHSGVLVSIEGTPFKATTDTTGKWTINFIPAGTYTINFTKDGFAPLKMQSYKFIGNGTDFFGWQELDQISNVHPALVIRAFEDYYGRIYRDSLYTYPNGDTITYSYPDSILVSLGRVHLSGSTTELPYINGSQSEMCIYFGRTNHIDPLDPTSYFYKSNIIVANNKTDPTDPYIQNDKYEFYFYRDSLQAFGLKTGDNIYAMAAAGGWNSQYSYYIDYATGKNVYTGFSPFHSDVKNLIMP